MFAPVVHGLVDIRFGHWHGHLSLSLAWVVVGGHVHVLRAANELTILHVVSLPHIGLLYRLLEASPTHAATATVHFVLELLG